MLACPVPAGLHGFAMYSYVSVLLAPETLFELTCLVIEFAREQLYSCDDVIPYSLICVFGAVKLYHHCRGPLACPALLQPSCIRDLCILIARIVSLDSACDIWYVGCIYFSADAVY